jgi:hypothetical protein
MTCFDGSDGEAGRSDRPVRTQSTACGQAVATDEGACGFALKSRLVFDLREIVAYALNRRSCAPLILGPAEPGLYSPPGNLVMSRSWFIALVSVCLVVVLAAARYGMLQIAESEVETPPPATSGRVQLVIDEQNVGVVKSGISLSVTFTVANTGTDSLVLRQYRAQHSQRRLPTFTIEPGQTGEVTAEIWSDELLDRGVKHVRFATSDPTSPELWLTVRGTVVRRAAASDDDESDQYW